MPKVKQAQLVVVNEQLLELQGVLGYSSIRTILSQFQAECKSAKELEISLSKVEKPQTVVLSLLLEMQRIAQQHKVEIWFSNVPDNLKGIALLNGVDKFVWG